MAARGVRSSARLATPAARARPQSAAAARSQAAARAGEAARRRARAAERAREVEDSPRVLRDKCRRLARALQHAKHLVVYTGAGISTAADIPDYRGPRGVWTRLQRGETVGRVEVSRARPTYTHMALTALWARGVLKFVASQNCDGLHVRAGLPRRALAELHGDMFAERCGACRRVYLRAFDTTERTARHAHGTRRLCHGCGAELADTIVHFGERGRAAWPLNWAGALRHAAAADVVLCLGSSLKVLRRYPRLWRMQRPPPARPALYIVNLQWTPKDAAAALKINARCDEVMAQVARRLRLRVPRYSPRRDPLLAHAEPLAPPEAHTTRRKPLSVPASSSESESESDDSLSSPSASESDDDVPLRRLAERLRGPPNAPAPAPARPVPAGPPDLLHSFQVSMHSGRATILLRAHHAPAVRPPGEPPPPALLPPRRPLSDLRRFRMARPPPQPSLPPPDASLNGHAGESEGERRTNGAWTLGSRLRRLLEYEPHPPPSAVDPGGRDALERDEDDERPADVKCEREVKVEDAIKTEAVVKTENGIKSECGVKREEGEGREARALAAAIFARAVLLCRASLYPGLHTIIAPPPRARARARPRPCAWCWRRLRATHCLWYGPPAGTPLEARAWRRVRGARRLCACCGEDTPAPAAGGDAGAGAGAGEERDEGGWYGKGYRKGRRRRR